MFSFLATYQCLAVEKATWRTPVGTDLNEDSLKILIVKGRLI